MTSFPPNYQKTSASSGKPKAPVRSKKGADCRKPGLGRKSPGEGGWITSKETFGCSQTFDRTSGFGSPLPGGGERESGPVSPAFQHSCCRSLPHPESLTGLLRHVRFPVADTALPFQGLCCFSAGSSTFPIRSSSCVYSLFNCLMCRSNRSCSSTHRAPVRDWACSCLSAKSLRSASW